MDITTLLGGATSLFSGTALRLIWGELSNLYTKYQDHKFELQRLDKQDAIDGNQHTRNLETLRVTEELKLQNIKIVGADLLDQKAAGTFDKGVELANSKTGIPFVDAANASVRFVLAYTFIILLWLDTYRAGFVLSDRMWELGGAVIGIFIADRSLLRRGK